MYNHLITKSRQRGLANSTMFFLLIAVIIGVWLLLKLIPFYMENKAVRNVLDELAANAEIQQKSQLDIKKIFLDSLAAKNQIRINNDNFDDYIQITKPVEGGVDIAVHYDQKSRITGNLYFMNKFEKSVEIR